MKVIVEFDIEQEYVSQQDVEDHLTKSIEESSLNWYWFPNGMEPAKHDERKIK